MKILITGGLGHIGSHLLENINKINKIKKVYVIDNLSTNRYSSLFNLPKSKKKNILFAKRFIYKKLFKEF